MRCLLKLRQSWLFKSTFAFLMVLAIAVPWAAFASDAAVTVTDTNGAVSSVTITSGDSAPINIKVTVTGPNVGTATFKVYRDWTLSGGTFTGSNPQQFSVPVRPNGPPPPAAIDFTTTGTVSVATGQTAGGPFTLQVSTFDITNSNTSGAKLGEGTASTYLVTVLAPVDPCASVASPAVPTFSSTPSSPGASGWFVTIPTVSASTTTDGATITYATEVNGGSQSLFSSSLPTIGEGTTKVYAKATSATCSKESVNSATYKVDTNAPALSLAFDPNTPDGQNGWWTTAGGVPFAWTCSDNSPGSGIDTAYNSGCPNPLSGTETAQGITSFTDQVKDVAGNSSAAVNRDLKLDNVDPVLNISGAGSSNSLDVCSIPTKPTFSPSDLTSLINNDPAKTKETWTTPSTPSGVGIYTYTALAEDNAGNTKTDTRTYTVKYGTAASSVLQPINTDNSSRFKLGSTVPVKFRIVCDGTPVTNAVAKLNVKQYDGNPNPGADEAISTAASTTGNLFRYDSTSQQYIFNLSTKQGYTNPSGPAISAFAQGTWTISIILDDGTSKSVDIQLVK